MKPSRSLTMTASSDESRISARFGVLVGGGGSIVRFERLPRGSMLIGPTRGGTAGAAGAVLFRARVGKNRAPACFRTRRGPVTRADDIRAEDDAATRRRRLPDRAVPSGSGSWP